MLNRTCGSRLSFEAAVLRTRNKLVTELLHRRPPSLLNISDGRFRKAIPPAPRLRLTYKGYVLTRAPGRNETFDKIIQGIANWKNANFKVIEVERDGYIAGITNNVNDSGISGIEVFVAL